MDYNGEYIRNELTVKVMTGLLMIDNNTLDELDYCLVFEYHQNGDLRRFLKTSIPTEFDILLDMAISLSHGLNYLHNKGIYYFMYSGK